MRYREHARDAMFERVYASSDDGLEATHLQTRYAKKPDRRDVVL